MIVFLKKVRASTIFSKFEPVKVEALELEYLKTLLDSIDVESYIIDDLFSINSKMKIEPDLVVLTGYNVSEGEILKQAGNFKQRFKGVKIIVGGVHIQKNTQDFHDINVDYVYHGHGLDSFKNLIEKIRNGEAIEDMPGVDINTYREDNRKRSTKTWSIGPRESISCHENYKADRSYFREIIDRTRYLEKKRVALIKGSVGCHYKCSYCYCKEVNEGHYIAADYNLMKKEIEEIDADYFWIVDDVLVSDRKQALSFIEVFKDLRDKKMIIYLRADFILKNIDLLQELRSIGIAEVIVGFESTDNKELKRYEKTTNALDYPKVIVSLKEAGIDLTALFMVNPDWGPEEFKTLNKFISNNKLEVFTLSILTPIKGTKTFKQFKEQLTTDDPRKFDFLHLVLPSKMPKLMFYSYFYLTHLKLLKSKRIWKYILRK
nr:radical SAM protein [Tissierella sp.]